MAQAPNNPFDNPTPQYQQPQSNNTWVWVLGILGGMFLLATAVCCGFFWYASTQFSGFVADAAMGEFADDPAIVEHIGEITESEMDFGEAITESSKDDDIAVMVFVIKGDKGSGKVLHRTNNATGETTAVLVMDSGEEYELDVSGFEDWEGDFTELEDMEAAMDDEAEVDLSGEGPAIEEGEAGGETSPSEESSESTGSETGE